MKYISVKNIKQLSTIKKLGEDGNKFIQKSIELS